MKKFFLMAIAICLFFAQLYGQSAVTYTFSGGRLGDDLVALLHAEWISYKNDIPLLYKPFPYSDQLAVHEQRLLYNENLMRQYSHVVEFKKNEYIKFDRNAQTLYIIPYFPESMEEYRIHEFDSYAGTLKSKNYPYFAVDWEDKIFIDRIKKLLTPLYPINLIKPPQDCINIAVQVRKNSGGNDRPLLNILSEQEYDPSIIYVDRVFPLKHPPDQYYIDQIKFVIQMFQGKKIYIFIFTDDPEPATIVKRYAQYISDTNIIFDYRRADNNHYTNVLEDLFSMLNFDCLIRPDSNLSIVASKLGNFKVLISPVSHRWDNIKLIIDKVSIFVRT